MQHKELKSAKVKELRIPHILEGDIWKIFYTGSNKEKYLQGYSFLPCCSILRDVFLESALACDELVSKARGSEAKIETRQETEQEKQAINKPNGKSHKIFGDEFEVWGLSINYKNFWHKTKNRPCVARGIKKIRKLFRR